MTKVAMMFAVVAAMLGAMTPANAAGRTWTECQYEDGSGQGRCVWLAPERGNGEGQSYIVRNKGQIKYVTHSRARRMLDTPK